MTRFILALVVLGLTLTVPARAQGFPPWGDDEVDALIYGPGLPVSGFGKSVDISGNLIAVGASADSTLASGAGAVHIRQRNLGGPGAWGTLLQFYGSATDIGDQLGWSVALSGTLCVAGARNGETLNGSTWGEAYIFDALSGAEIARLPAPTSDPTKLMRQFGRTVDTDGAHVVVAGAYDSTTVPGINDFGLAYLYDASGTFLFDLVPSGILDSYGAIVSVEGAYCAVSAPRKNPVTGTATGPGAVHVFDTSTGAELYVLSPAGLGAGTEFGLSLDIDSGRLLVGSKAWQMWCYDLATGTELWNWNAEGLYQKVGERVALSGNFAYASMGTAGSSPAIGRVAQVCVESAQTVTWFHHDATGAASVPTLAASALAADGNIVVAGSELGGITTVSEGSISVMTRKRLGFGINKEVAFPSDTLDLNVRGGEPGLSGGFVVTEVNGVPVFFVLYVAPFDANGEVQLNGLSLMGGSGVIVELIGAGYPKNGGALTLTGPRTLAIL